MAFRDWLPWSRGYAATILAIARSAAEGTSAKALGTIEACAGIWGRGLAASEVSGSPQFVADAIGPAMLEKVGRDLLLYGQSVWDIRNGGTRLVPVSAHELTGGPDADTWRYGVTMPGPSTTEVSRVPRRATDVLHFRMNVSPDRPWEGVSPLLSTGDVNVAAALEAFLQSEADQLNDQLIAGSNLPTGDRQALESLEQLRRTRSADRRGQKQLRPVQQLRSPDIKVVKLGPQISASAVQLRGDLRASIIDAAGLSGMFSAEAETATRETMRRTIALTLGPVAKIVEAECRAKLAPATVSIDVAMMARQTDIASRARGFQAIRAGGMSLEDAGRNTGLIVETSEEAPPPPPPQPDEGDDE